MLNITTLAVLLVVLGAYTHALNIKTVSDKKIIKRETDGEFYPDWVPFKNKKGEELGEFVQVKKKKPAKRLALPVNFLLKPVAETEGEDYYEKGQGDGEDYYEKKEWSDQLRTAKQAAPVKVLTNNTEANVEGTVNIVTSDKHPTMDVGPSTITESDSLALPDEENKLEKKTAEDISIDINKEDSEVKVESNESETKDNKEKQENSKIESEEYNDYEEESTEKAKPEQTEEEKQQAEAKKQRILGLVDDLKRRHEKEQREISERAKEDEIIKEERDRELSRGRIILQPNEADEGYDKYNSKNYNKDRPKPNYDDYDETTNVDDKYKIHPPTKKRPPVTTTIAPVTSSSVKPIIRTPKRKRTKSPPNKHGENGKLSVFKNPKLYMLYDDDTTDETSTAVSSTKSPRISARMKQRRPLTSTSPSTTPALPTSRDSNESVRISLVPENDDTKDGEPTLFFPQRRKNKRRRKNRTRSSTPEPDSHVAESVNGFAKDVMNPAPVASTETITSTRPEDSSPLAAAPSAAVSDPVASASGHVEPKHENYEVEKGAEREHFAEHMSEHGEKGKKAYEGLHKDTKAQKGHHDKESHQGSYADRGGFEKEHHVASDHYGAHHHEEHGKKHAKYEESGKHSKGHSTKGSHDIHKKEEYEKKVEFFEEDGDSAEEEKHGGYQSDQAHSSGGHFKNSKLHAGHHDRAKGDAGHFEKGGHVHVQKGHKSAVGHDSHGAHGKAKFQKGGTSGGKKWVYHHGTPAKTANLVAIDRKADHFYHGPQYFG
ncbi:myb-like protein X [Hyposmocoma kahamanoa]|uniref:myb-like protein X n=1 Tax=Hyposmocoma kahamanoa TaxID=1477025 RepID=UPI000E6D5EF2|nr:myb-like protein X [Hyposmocoma kahamanoa]